MTEILDYARSIEVSKEDIRQAMVARGVVCDQSVPLSDYADKINNMIVSGNVDNVQVLNCTGRTIHAGEKVFFKKNVYIGSSKTKVNSNGTSSSNYYYLINPNGTKIFYNDYVYDIATDKTISTEYSTYSISSSTYGNNQIYYDEYGNMFAGCYLLDDDANNFNFSFTENGYAWDKFQSDSKYYLHLYRLNKQDFSIEKTWIINYPASNSYEYTSHLIVIGNKIYWYSSGSSKYYFNADLDENLDTITNINVYTQHAYASYIYPLHTTSDNKIAICSCANDSSTFSLQGLQWHELHFMNLDENLEMTDKFITSNADLLALQNLLDSYITFNRNTNTLFIGGSNSNNYYGIFKWNTTLNDFETVVVNLKNFEVQSGKLITASTDLTKIQLSNYLYGLEQNGEGYKALNYHSYIGDDVLTGVALGNASNGQTFNVKTILP